MKGNVLDLAVAVIIAAAFGAIVTSFTNDIFMPVIGMALGDVDFSEMKYILQEAHIGENGSVIAGEIAVRWGQFVNYIIDFLIIALVLFLIVKVYNNSKKKEVAAPAAPAGPSVEELLTDIRELLKK